MIRYRTDPEGLRRRRRSLGESQRVFADKCGVDRAAVAHAERGKRSLSVSALMAVAARLDVAVEDLLTPQQDQPRAEESLRVTA